MRPGELVASTTVLPGPKTGAPGDSALSVGFYDPSNADQRGPAQDAQGQALDNNEVILAQVIVETAD